MSPIDIEDFLERAKRAVRVGDYEEAERLLKNYIAKTPESREARLLMGTALARMGRLDEAEDEFNTLTVKNPLDADALNNLAVMYRRQGKYQSALGCLIQAIDIDPTRAEFHYNIGNIHKEQKNYKAAQMAYAKVIELNPSYVPAYNNLGTIYDELGEHEKAFTVFRKGLARDRNNPVLRYNYGLALEAKDSLEEAAGQYRASIRSRPGWSKPMNNLGAVYLKQGNYRNAGEIFRRLLETDPSNAEAWNNTGIIKADQGHSQEAAKNYRKALELDPRYARAAVNLSRLLEESGDTAGASAELEKAVENIPDNVELRDRFARLCLLTENYPEALTQAQAALELKDDDVEALRIYGALQRINGNEEAAHAAFEKILAVDPGNHVFHLDLADIYFHHEEYARAEEELFAYLKLEPDNGNAKRLLGRIYAKMGQRAKAIGIFEDLALSDPNDTEALGAAAELHHETGSFEKAVLMADALVNVQGHRASADDLSDLNKSLEFYENAVGAYSASVREQSSRLAGIDKKDSPEDDFSLLLDSSGIVPESDEKNPPAKDKQNQDEEIPPDNKVPEVPPVKSVKIQTPPSDEAAAEEEEFFIEPAEFFPAKDAAPDEAVPLQEAPPFDEVLSIGDFFGEKETLPESESADEPPAGDMREPCAGIPAPVEEEADREAAEPPPEELETRVFLDESDIAPPGEDPAEKDDAPVIQESCDVSSLDASSLDEEMFPVEAAIPPESDSASGEAAPLVPIQVSEAVPEESPESDGLAATEPYNLKPALGLLNYLKSLVKYLPEKEKTAFLQSEVRLELEHVIGTLETPRGDQ